MSSGSRMAIIYARVSSPQQVKQGHGLDSQIQICEEHGIRLGFEIVDVFTDNVTGKSEKRDGMDRALRFLRKNRAKNPVILIDDVSRLAREVKGHWSLREEIAVAGGEIFSPRFQFGNDADSRFNENIQAASAQHQREKNNETVLARMRGRLLAGYWCLRAPVGYKSKLVPGHGKLIMPERDVEAVIKEALEGFACGRFETQAEVQRFLEQCPEFERFTGNSGHFKIDRVRIMLQQVLYTGHLCYPKWDVSLRKAHHPAIISMETHQQILDRLNGRAIAPVRKDLNEDFPLRNFMLCAECGYHLTAAWSKGRRQEYAYYHCCHRPCSEYKKSIRRADLESCFERVLRDMEPHEELFSMAYKMLEDIWQKRKQTTEVRNKELARKLASLKGDEARLIERIVKSKNEVLVAAYEDRLAELHTEIAVAEEKLSESVSSSASFESLFEHSTEFLSSPYKIWKNSTYRWRRTILRLAFSKKPEYSRSEGLRTPELSFPFKALHDAANGKGGLVEEAGIDPSVGSVGDSYDNALAESIIGLFKTEVINFLGPWKSVSQVEWETLKWVSWYNSERLHSAIGYVTPHEAEEEFHANMNALEKAA